MMKVEVIARAIARQQFGDESQWEEWRAAAEAVDEATYVPPKEPPSLVRSTDPGTSRDAAAAVQEREGVKQVRPNSKRHMMLLEFEGEHDGLTMDEPAIRLERKLRIEQEDPGGKNSSTCRSLERICTDFHRWGLVIPTGTKRKSTAEPKSSRTVLRITALGYEALDQVDNGHTWHVLPEHIVTGEWEDSHAAEMEQEREEGEWDD